LQKNKNVILQHILKNQGFVNNCNPEQKWKYLISNEESYYEKDRVFVRILDIDGVLVTDGSHLKNNMARNNDIELSAYTLTHVVNRSDKIYNTMGKNIVTVYNNQCFFYLPEIHQFDFEHRKIYQIELKYGDHTRTVWFAVLDPDKKWDED